MDHRVLNGSRGWQCDSYFRNLFVFSGPEPYSAWPMNYHPHSHPNWRSPRAPVADLTPVVLRLSDGSCFRGNLEIISLTGGLVSLSNVLDRSSRVMLMFLTPTGLVQTTAEMLSPVSRTRRLGGDGRGRFQTAPPKFTESVRPLLEETRALMCE